MSTKDFSSKQENQISKLLGWSTVSASGARNFHPGDIRSDRWLGECKTHMKCSDKILFKFSEYDKICKESTEEFRFPALFVDDGSQLIKHTWVMFDPVCVPNKMYFDTTHSSDLAAILNCNKSTLSFNHSKMIELYNRECRIRDSINIQASLIIHCKFNNKEVGIVPLEVFKDICDRMES